MASAPIKPLELPTKLRSLYDFMRGKGEVDIVEIYMNVIDPDPRERRFAQQRVSPYITRLNRRLREHHQVVKPGRLRGTYVLTVL